MKKTELLRASTGVKRSADFQSFEFAYISGFCFLLNFFKLLSTPVKRMK